MTKKSMTLRNYDTTLQKNECTKKPKKGGYITYNKSLLIIIHVPLFLLNTIPNTN